MNIMSDFELHKLCPHYKGLSEYELRDEDILDSGKFHCMNELLQDIQKAVGYLIKFKIILQTFF